MTDAEFSAAEFVSGLRLETVPEAVVREARLLTADTVAVTVAGASDPEVTRLSSNVAGGASDEATILGTDRRTSGLYAGLVNGVSSSVLELNAGHKYAAGHPVVHLLAALLAEAEARDSDGEDFLAALVAGYEVCARAGMASGTLAPGYSPFGIWGTVGAAAAVARQRGLDAETTLDAMRLAAASAQHSRVEGMAEGASGVRNGPIGVSNVNGILATDLAEAGFGGITAGITKHLDPTTEHGFDAWLLADELGDRWEIRRGYYKLHAAGRLAHPVLDAVERLQERRKLGPEAVESVLVETYEKAATWLATQRPTNRFQAKTSIPFCVATRLVSRSSGVEAFDESALTDEVLELAERVAVRTDPAIEDRVPDARSARVTVRTTDGREVIEEVEHARGGEERPYTETELREKFTSLTTKRLDEARSRELWGTIDALPESSPAEMARLASRSD
jgi:2-methylcitrate dehydratase PrpD